MTTRPNFPVVSTAWSLLVLAIVSAAGFAQEGEQAGEGAGEEAGIRDNSFLLEEAFNQEQGVVQHIFNWVPSWERDGVRGNAFDFVFTQEWPVFSQRHQFSYTLPMLYQFEQAPGEPSFEGQGFGDMLLNYRFQALDGKVGGWWAAPRFSVILPTGDEQDGLGNGEVGYQVNLPLSKEFERWAVHLNAGLTIIPGVGAGIDPGLSPLVARDLNGYNLGGSAIYFLRPNFHLMLENVAIWDEELEPDATEVQTFEYLLSPGFRWAPFTEGDTQWVIGAAVPIGLSEDAPDLSAFLYMSFEHRVRAKRCE
ncbi:MAG: transporter [Pirellulales bacterium]|nr:transporter [Pirellulales bacterium]